MEVTWFGHSTLGLRTGGVEFITDPVLRSRILHLRRYHDPPELSPGGGERVVLISHLHYDHLDLPTLRSFGRSTPILTGPGGGSFLSRRGFTEVTELWPGETLSVRDSVVRAVEAEHRGGRSPIHGRHRPIGFVIEGSRSAYFAGDTDLFPGMAEQVGDVDLAMLPIWGWGPNLGPGHLDPEKAALAAGMISPAVAIPIHWGTFSPIGRGVPLTEPAERFHRLSRNYAPGTEVRVLSPGDSTAIA